MDDYPENTVAAFRAAAPQADVVECDVQRCRSGELVVFHDETLDRATDGNGRVDETDWSQLQELRVHGSDERIPLLEEVLAAVPADTTVTVELKAEGIADDVVDAIERVDNDVIVSSFYWDELRAARDAGASTLAVLCHEDPEGALALAAELDCEYVHPPKELCLDTDFVRRAHDRGVKVNVWTAETPEDVDELRAAGVDGVSTNRIDIVKRVP
ncbi:MAG: glycerophosphodiester phosphodiesterase [Haloarculaceae archaeon]